MPLALMFVKEFYMEVFAKRTTYVVAGMLALSFVSMPAATAAPNQAVDACKTAIAAEHEADYRTSPKKIKSRGGTYEVWLNLQDGDTQLKAFCVNKRGDVQVSTSAGAWKGSNPKRPTVT